MVDNPQGNEPQVPETRALVPSPAPLALMPVMSLLEADARYDSMVKFVKSKLREGVDFGKIPGVEKASLLKPGAEKLCRFFGLSAEFDVVDKLERWDDGDPLFFYRYRCNLTRDGYLVANGEGSANSREDRYQRWVSESEIPANIDKARLPQRSGERSEFAFAIDKAETGGQYGKPAAYWKQFRDAIAAGTATSFKRETAKGEKYDAWKIGGTEYRIPRDTFTLVNTLGKMAQKRAFVAATLVACNASDFFTQDVEDFAPAGDPDVGTVTTIDQGTGEITRSAVPSPEAGAKSPNAPAVWEEDLIQTFLADDELVPVGSKHAYHVVNLLNLSRWKPGDGHPIAWKVKWGGLYRARKVRIEQDMDSDSAPTKEDAKRITHEAVAGADFDWVGWAQDYPEIVPPKNWPAWADEMLKAKA